MSSLNEALMAMATIFNNACHMSQTMVIRYMTRGALTEGGLSPGEYLAMESFFNNNLEDNYVYMVYVDSSEKDDVIGTDVMTFSELPEFLDVYDDVVGVPEGEVPVVGSYLGLATLFNLSMRCEHWVLAWLKSDETVETDPLLDLLLNVRKRNHITQEQADAYIANGAVMTFTAPGKEKLFTIGMDLDSVVTRAEQALVG